MYKYQKLHKAPIIAIEMMGPIATRIILQGIGNKPTINTPKIKENIQKKIN